MSLSATTPTCAICRLTAHPREAGAVQLQLQPYVMALCLCPCSVLLACLLRQCCACVLDLVRVVAASAVGNSSSAAYSNQHQQQQALYNTKRADWLFHKPI